MYTCLGCQIARKKLNHESVTDTGKVHRGRIRSNESNVHSANNNSHNTDKKIDRRISSRRVEANESVTREKRTLRLGFL